MSTNYRDQLGNHITFDEWKEKKSCPTNCSKETEITKGEYKLVVSKVFCGTSGSLFKVIVDCSEDLEDFFGYHVGFQGQVKAENDYNRCVAAINEDAALMEDGKVIEA